MVDLNQIPRITYSCNRWFGWDHRSLRGGLRAWWRAKRASERAIVGYGMVWGKWWYGVLYAFDGNPDHEGYIDHFTRLE